MLTHGKYLLDTCVCIAFIKKHPSVIKHLRRVHQLDCKISEITIAELFYGAYNSEKEEHFEDVNVIARDFEQYPITGSLREYARLRWLLKKKGTPVDHLDLFIAATALEENLILVTGNVKHFERIPGLRIENWMED